MTNAQKMAEILANWEASENNSGASDGQYNRCSEIGWINDCKRHLVLARICPDKRVTDPLSYLRFAEGRRQEREMRQVFQWAGVETEESTTKEPFLLTDLQLRGEHDDIVVIDGERYVVDYKSCSEQMFGYISTYQDVNALKVSPFIWIRHYAWQMVPYMAALGVNGSMLVFKSKEIGRWHFISVPFNVPDWLIIRDGLAEINEMVKNGNVPEAINDDKICNKCDFREFCYKDAVPQNVKSVTSEELVALLNRRDELLRANIKPLIKELEDVEDQIKEAVEAIGEHVMVGDYFITYEKGTRKTLDLPVDIRNKYTVLKDYMKPMKIKNFGAGL